MKGTVSKSLPYREPHVRGSGGENLGEGWHTTPRGRGPSSAVHVESRDHSPRRIGPVRRRMHRMRRTTTSGLGPPPPPPVRMAYPYVRSDVQGRDALSWDRWNWSATSSCPRQEQHKLTGPVTSQAYWQRSGGSTGECEEPIDAKVDTSGVRGGATCDEREQKVVCMQNPWSC